MAGRPDVRVRLSAEGVAEVVAALKRVQAESQRTAQKQSRGFQGLNRILGSTRNLLGGLGLALGVHQFQRWIRGAVDAADAIAKTGKRVGAAVENLSALHLVARISGSSLEEVAKALAKQNKYIGDAAAGNPKAIASFRDLGLTLADFKGKDAVEIFELISQRITALPSPIQRGKAAMDIFGRSGSNLIPTMKDLADEGLGAVIERARELGVLIDTDLAASAERIKDDFELLKAQSEGLGTRLAAGLVPEVSQALQTISGDLAQTTDAWESFGAGIGRVIKWIVAVVSAGFDYAGTYLGMMMSAIDAGIRSLVDLIRGDLDSARRHMQTFGRFAGREAENIRERMKGRFELAVSTPPPRAEGETTTGAEGEIEEEAAELAAKRAQALQMALDRELALAKTAASLRSAAEKRAFEEGLKDIRTYYADRRAIVDRAYEEELAVLEQKRGLLDEMTDPGMRLQEEKKVDAALAKARLEHENAVGALLFEERETVRSIARERIALEKTLLEAQGKRIEAERLGFEEQIEQADLLLRKQGTSDEKREAVLARLRAALEAGADFEEAKRDAEAALAEFEAARAEVEARTPAGLLSQFEAEVQILALEEGRIETLKELALALEAAAEATGDPEKIAQAQSFAAAIREIDYSVQASADSFGRFKETALDSATDALTDFLDKGMEGSKSLKDAFRDMALAIIADLRRLAAQLIATAIVKKIAGLFGEGGVVGGEGAEAKAEGGLFRGRGTGTSDSNLVWLSNEEYVVRAAVVRQPGVLKHLEDLNRQGVRSLVSTPVIADVPATRFAEGGLVEKGAVADDGGVLNGRLVLGLEDGLVLREMDTPTGQRILIRALSNNRRAVRSALGI